MTPSYYFFGFFDSVAAVGFSVLCSGLGGGMQRLVIPALTLLFKIDEGMP